jgi:hypothetical protein
MPLVSIVVITFLPFFPLLRPSIAIEPKSPSIMADPIPIENTSTNVIETILIIPIRSASSRTASPTYLLYST